MKTSYEYGFGKIKDILNGKTNRADSIEDLDLSEEKTLIIIPKIIGVYQRDGIYNGPPGEEILSTMEQLTVSTKTGNIEEMTSNLICVIYDPTIIQEDILKKVLKKDILGRVKYTRHGEQIPDFYKKNIPDFEVIKNASLSSSSANIAVLERLLEHLELAKEDFGLTRYESLGLEAGKSFLGNIGRKPILIGQSLISKFKEEDIENMRKGKGFGDYMRGFPF